MIWNDKPLESTIVQLNVTNQMDLKSAVQTVKPIEMNVKWWKDNVREKMFSLNILENAVKESGPIFGKKHFCRKFTIFGQKLIQQSGFQARF